VLVKVAEREALVMPERPVNIVDTQGLQAWTSPTIMIGRVVWVFKSAYSLCTRVPPSVECRVTLFHVFYDKSLIFSESGKGSSLRRPRGKYSISVLWRQRQSTSGPLVHIPYLEGIDIFH